MVDLIGLRCVALCRVVPCGVVVSCAAICFVVLYCVVLFLLHGLPPKLTSRASAHWFAQAANWEGLEGYKQNQYNLNHRSTTRVKQKSSFLDWTWGLDRGQEDMTGQDRRQGTGKDRTQNMTRHDRT